jgi:hypothetical protein
MEVFMDFRSGPVEATLRALASSPGAALSDLGESGCIPVAGGRRWHYIVELPTLVISLACSACAFGALPLKLLGVLPSRLLLPVLIVGLGVLLVVRWIKAVLLGIYLSSRSDSLLKAFSELPRKSVGLEDGESHQKLKVVIEDEGVCLLDSEKRRLLIEGCSHRYVIYGKDVRSIEPVWGYAKSGVLLECTVAGQDMKVMLCVAGQGPIASLTEAFKPSKGAKDLARILNDTLFAAQSPGL